MTDGDVANKFGRGRCKYAVLYKSLAAYAFGAS